MKENEELENLVSTIKDNEGADKLNAILKLAAHYHSRNLNTDNKSLFDFTKSAALYHYGRKYCEVKQIPLSQSELLNIEQSICDIENNLIQQLGKNPRNNLFTYQKSCKEHKESLKFIRNKTKNYLEALQETENLLRLCPVALIEFKVSQVQKLYSLIQKYIKLELSILILECLIVLGKPPCEFSVIGLGSLARGEMTLYSDVEFAILVSDETESTMKYFVNMTHLLFFKIINLGETILPSVAIKELNDYESLDSSGDWFYDDVTPRGFAFDGQMPKASKTPLGKCVQNEEYIDALIFAPTDNKIEKFIGDKRYQSDRVMATMLSTVTLIYGDNNLIKEYQEKIKKYLNSKSESEEHNRYRRIVRSCSLLNDISGQFEPNTGRVMEHGNLIHVKNNIFRLPSLCLEYLFMFFDVKGESPWEKIANIPEVSMHSNVKTHLRSLITEALLYRIQTYLHYNAQKDSLVYGRDQQGNENVLSIGLNRLKVIYNQLYPLCYILYDFSDSFGQRNRLLDSASFDDSYGIAQLLLLQQLSMHRDVVAVTDVILQTASAKLNDEDNNNQDLVYGPSYFYAQCCHIFSRSYFELQKLQEAENLYLSALEVQPNNPALYTGLAELLDEMGQYDKAIAHHEAAINIIENNNESRFRHSQPSVYSAYGFTLLKSGQFQKAIGHLQQAVQLASYNPAFYEQRRLAYQCNLAQAFAESYQFSSALELFKSILFDTEKAKGLWSYSSIIVIFHIGQLKHSMGRYVEAKICYEFALKLIGAPCEDIFVELNRRVMSDLALTYKALGHYQHAMKIIEKVHVLTYRHCKINPHLLAIADNNRADLCGLIGGMNGDIKLLRQATNYYEKAIKKSELYPNVKATALSGLGLAYMEISKLEHRQTNLNLAEKTLRSALLISQELYQQFNELKYLKILASVYNHLAYSIRLSHNTKEKSLEIIGYYNESIILLQNISRMSHCPFEQIGIGYKNLAMFYLEKPEGNLNLCYVKALQALTKSIEIFYRCFQNRITSDMADAYFLMAKALFQLNFINEGIDFNNRANCCYEVILRAQNDNLHTWLRYGNSLLLPGNYREKILHEDKLFIEAVRYDRVKTCHKEILRLNSQNQNGTQLKNDVDRFLKKVNATKKYYFDFIRSPTIVRNYQHSVVQKYKKIILPLLHKVDKYQQGYLGEALLPSPILRLTGECVQTTYHTIQNMLRDNGNQYAQPRENANRNRSTSIRHHESPIRGFRRNRAKSEPPNCNKQNLTIPI